VEEAVPRGGDAARRACLFDAGEPSGNFGVEGGRFDRLRSDGAGATRTVGVIVMVFSMGTSPLVAASYVAVLMSVFTNPKVHPP
jgi:hypothetical protein